MFTVHLLPKTIFLVDTLHTNANISLLGCKRDLVRLDDGVAVAPLTRSMIGSAVVIGNRLPSLAFVLLLFVGGCGHKKQATLPPAEGDVATGAAVGRDTVKSPPIDPEILVSKPTEKLGWIYKESVNVRGGPSTTAPIVTRLSRGTQVKLLEKTQQWWQIQLGDSAIAYIHESMVSQERYVDPWTQFRLGGRLADSTLQIIVGVTELEGSKKPAAALTVDPSWANHSKVKKQRVAQAAFAYWKVCLQKSGYDVRGATILLRDGQGKDLVRVTGAQDKTTVEFLSQ